MAGRVMTAAEAKTKWCPFARTAPYGGNSVNRDPENGEPHNYALCLASACMAWRERTVYNDDGPEPEPRGYCGLVGVAGPAPV